MDDGDSGGRMKGTLISAFLFGALFCISDVHAQETSIPNQLEDSNQSSPKEMLDFATAAISEIQEIAQTVSTLMKDAEKSGDSERIDCVRDRQAQIRALQQVSERSESSMQEALASGSTDRAGHELRKVAVALSKVRQLLAESEGCGGQIGVSSGEFDIDVSHSGLTDSDDTEGQDVDDLDSIEPPDTSPFE